MKQRQLGSREQQERDEEACASAFLAWYNDCHGTDYQRPVRPEVKFPDLAGGPRWEFAVDSESAPHKWLAIEVKRLSTLVELEKNQNEWAKVCSDLSRLLADRVTGGFELDPPLDLAMRQQEKKTLCTLLACLIERNAPNMHVSGPSLDLGHQVAEQVRQWPTAGPEPEHFLLTKVADSGCKVTLASTLAQGDGAKWHKRAVHEAFKRGRTGEVEAKASCQLARAKELGADKTILLLDCDPNYDEHFVSQSIRELDRSLICHIDSIYLVGRKGVQRVLP